MLKCLDVKDFAIIEDLHVDFLPGMTVLTGETGAGKSLVIDTISLLLGERADSDMIRYGKTKATILGVFTFEDVAIRELLEKNSIQLKEDLTIYREISNNRNVIKINETTVSLTLLKQIAALLADIHVQNDTFKLFDRNNYLDFLTPSQDNNYDKLFNAYTLSYSTYLNCFKNYNHILNGQK